MSPSISHARGTLKDLLSGCDEYCQNRKANAEQDRQIQAQAAQPSQFEMQRDALANQAEPFLKANSASMSVPDFIAYGNDIDGNKVSVKGDIYCENLKSCTIHAIGDERKSIWFDPSHLSLDQKKALLSCPADGLCYSILIGKAENVSLNQNGKSISEEGIIASDAPFVHVSEMQLIFIQN